MPLTKERKKQYRTLSHSLKPIVTLASNGLSAGVQDEINRALNDHELIKIKLAIADRTTRKTIVREICQITGAQIIHEIGKVALIFREAKRPNLKLSNVNSGKLMP